MKIVRLLLRGVAKGDPEAAKVIVDLLESCNVGLLTAEHAQVVARLYKEQVEEENE